MADTPDDKLPPNVTDIRSKIKKPRRPDTVAGLRADFESRQAEIERRVSVLDETVANHADWVEFYRRTQPGLVDRLDAEFAESQADRDKMREMARRAEYKVDQLNKRLADLAKLKSFPYSPGELLTIADDYKETRRLAATVQWEWSQQTKPAFERALQILAEHFEAMDGRIDKLQEAVEQTAKASPVEPDRPALGRQAPQSRDPGFDTPALPLIPDSISVGYCYGDDAAGIRTLLVRDDDVWFDLDDLCDILAIGDTGTLANAIPSGLLRGGEEGWTHLLPGGLPAAAALSKLPPEERDALSDWLEHQVLPSAEALAVRCGYSEEYAAPPRDLYGQGALPVFAGKIGARHCQVVDARTLHHAADMAAPFAVWFSWAVEQAGLVEHQDYAAVLWAHPPVEGRPPVDYYLTLEGALAMIRTTGGEAAEQVRAFLANCRQWLARREVRVADRERRLGTGWPHIAADGASAMETITEAPAVTASAHNPASAFPADGLVRVAVGEIGGRACPVVDARDLHGFIGSKDAFAHWIKDQLERARLKENKHFVCLGKNPSKKSGRGGHNRIDYFLSLHGAIHVAMAANTGKAFEVRDYFIECEERLRELQGHPAQAIPAQPAQVWPADQPASPHEPRVFHFEGHPVRVVVHNGRPWFAAADTLRALGYAANPGQTAERLLGDHTDQRRPFMLASGQCVRTVAMLSGLGVSILLGRSAKPRAAAFKIWLAEDVLLKLSLL